LSESSNLPLYAFGLNHESAPLAVRERVVFEGERLAAALAQLMEGQVAEEAVILSTCNRTEIYCHTRQPDQIFRWLAQHPGLEGIDLTPYLYRLDGSAVARHAFRVASGLDSMVLGEPQILGQVKQAVRQSQHAGALGVLLGKLFQNTFATAKSVRTDTAIGERSVSLAAATLKLSESVLGALNQQRVLLVGAGEMIELMAAHFHAHQPQSITIANRTLERGRALAESVKGHCITLSELAPELARNDIVVSCTASNLPLIGKGMVERAIRQRKHRPIVMVDLAVPRDIEPEVGELADVFLYSVDDLGEIVRENQGSRQKAVEEAENIIARRVEEFVHWTRSREQVPVIRLLRSRAETHRQAELERARRALARGDAPEKVLEALSLGLTNKFLHQPTRALHQSAQGGHVHLAEAIQWLFAADEGEEDA
jgi:glutamyl-tRNA reductase